MSISLRDRPPRTVSSSGRSSISPSFCTAQTPRTSTTLLDLPPEIHLHILDYLWYPYILRLRATNRYFHALLVYSVLFRKREAYAQYLLRTFVDEPLPASFAPCLICLRLRPRYFFDDKNWELQWEVARYRMCIECRMRIKAYDHGELFWWQKYMTRCARCGEIRARERCTDKQGGICRQCDDWRWLRQWDRRLHPYWVKRNSHWFIRGLICPFTGPLALFWMVSEWKSTFYISTAIQATLSGIIVVWTSVLLIKHDYVAAWLTFWLMITVSKITTVDWALVATSIEALSDNAKNRRQRHYYCRSCSSSPFSIFAEIHHAVVGIGFFGARSLKSD